MRRFSFVLMATLLGLTVFALAGCSDDDNPVTTDNNPVVQIEKVSPPDGATDVSTSSSIAIKFSGPVDTASIMGNFHFSGGNSMHMWKDSLDHYGGFGMMGMMMQSHMVEWMDSIHIRGEFHWNNGLDSCEFIPGTPMDTSTGYLCLLEEGGMRGMGGGMMGGMNHGDSGYHMFEFSTGPGPSGVPALVSISPADGSSGVSASAEILMVFDMPMDSHSVMSSFHFLGGDNMHEWMDSLSHHMGMGGMGMIDMGHMMAWMDSVQHDGVFHWNDAMDSCLFLPDSSMMPSTEYMIYMNGDIHGHNGEMMDMHHLDYDGHMVHFATGP